jgi:L-ascorbate metabolism protein UlaG (beta-lactamase superfamily)
MQIQLIRSATLRVTYAGHLFVIDPYLAAKHELPSYTGKSRNPLVDLPCSPQEVIAGIEMAVISHLHSDHFDPAAQSLLPKETLIFCQPGDEARLKAKGFVHATPVSDLIQWEGITLRRIPGQHGTGEVLKDMGEASGFIFQADNEPSVYWAGDTILSEAVAQVISREQPKLIITHSSGAVWRGDTLIVMDAGQTVQVCRAAPHSTVVATHMESLDHGTVTRQSLRLAAEAAGVGADRLLIPADGEKLIFE